MITHFLKPEDRNLEQSLSGSGSFQPQGACQTASLFSTAISLIVKLPGLLHCANRRERPNTCLPNISHPRRTPRCASLGTAPVAGTPMCPNYANSVVAKRGALVQTGPPELCSRAGVMRGSLMGLKQQANGRSGAHHIPSFMLVSIPHPEGGPSAPSLPQGKVVVGVSHSLLSSQNKEQGRSISE
ncbi:hypothetical protein NHX12_025537 [Muraenolepis orangiensis]|uniref:Uncharacterized protein n=1 Tax=Muraenolepis orangiensis TaxID=630683 RepID=A0A9Q0EJB1_9TELE|nr:hypothetical protein NHX12_025537 [Muraenolepis orangiensis]